MDQLNELTAKATKWIQDNPRLSVGIASVSSLLLINRLYNKIQYSRLQFDPSTTDLSTVGILVTGCDTGFGNVVAKKLNNLGYCVFATCYTAKSVSEFNNDTSFTKHGSFALQMDVSNLESIATCKQQILKWLENDQKRVLWSIVNNAGFAYPGIFEMVPHKLSMDEYNVLFFGVINVTRAFLPLIKNRRNLDRNTITYADGGRVVNVASLAAEFYGVGLSRYAVSKAAVKTFSHCLRAEYAPTFGIWSSSIQPGFFKTNIANASTGVYMNRLVNYYYKDGGNGDLKDDISEDEKEVATTFKINEYAQRESKLWSTASKKWEPDLSPVINNIIHGITAKYPKTAYFPGFGLQLRMFHLMPLKWLDSMIFQDAKGRY